MKVVLAPDSFKGSASAMDVCEAMKEGIREIDPNVDIAMAPMADGGEGTVENLVQAYSGQTVAVEVMGPAGKPVTAKYGILRGAQFGEGLCVVEVAETSGLTLLRKEERNPMKTTTYGFGQLILDALDKGCKRFVIGLGGSGTNDGGCGMAMALGYELLDEAGMQIGLGGGSLADLAEIRTEHVDPRIFEADFMVACDVKNPLCGTDGASHVFGPQKGATPEDVQVLDANLKRLAEVIKRDMGRDVLEVPGAGAAGGLGAGTMAFLNGTLREGIKIISELLELAQKVSDADLVFTGEGRCDFQTLKGKTPFGVVSVAEEYHVPSIIVAGSVGEGLEPFYDKGVIEIIGLQKEGMTIEYAKKHAQELIKAETKNAFSRFLMKR